MSLTDILVVPCPTCDNTHTLPGLGRSTTHCPGLHTVAHQNGCCHFGEKFVVTDDNGHQTLVDSPCTALSA